MLAYTYNPEKIQISETENEKDIEFTFRFTEIGKYEESMIKIKDFFEHNDIYTDVLFNVYEGSEYQAFVKKEYYMDFILALMKHHLLEKVEWV